MESRIDRGGRKDQFKLDRSNALICLPMASHRLLEFITLVASPFSYHSYPDMYICRLRPKLVPPMSLTVQLLQ